MAAETRACSKCGQDKPSGSFLATKNRQCAECRAAYKRTWGQRPEYLALRRVNYAEGGPRTESQIQAARDAQFRKALRNKGITAEKYTEMFEAQGGKCAVCFKPETVQWRGTVRRLSVDHDRVCCPGDRACGMCVRGLLCFSCNVTLGHVADDDDLLVRLAEYVRLHRVL